MTNRYTFVYDGWNMIYELRTENGEQGTNSYLWGLDVSGTLQGAGGVGGALAMTSGTNTLLYCYDGNGNVMNLVASDDGTEAATYEYDPFGNQIRSTANSEPGTENPFRFSTKYVDDSTELVYYGYRYYSPELGRWMSRDPIGEQDAAGLHVFNLNAPSDRWDSHGLFSHADVAEGRVRYSCNCGWIDEKHVLGPAGMWRDISASMTAYEKNRNTWLVLRQSQKDRVTTVIANYFFHYDGALTGKERIEFAAGVYLHFQKRFEAHQEGFFAGSSIKHSGFSVEDLPSDYLGFMQEAGVISKNLEDTCPRLEREESLRMFLYGDGVMKNDVHRPRLWTYRGLRQRRHVVSRSSGEWGYYDPALGGDHSPEAIKSCDPCRNKCRTPPSIFSDYVPVEEGESTFSVGRIQEKYTYWNALR